MSNQARGEGLLKIEILGKAEDKTKMEQVAKMIRQAATVANVIVEISFTHNFGAFSSHSFNVAKTPIVFVDGQLEFVGMELNLGVVIKKLTEEKGSQTF